MKKLNKNSIVTTVLTVALVLGLTGSTALFAAAPTPVDLGSASNFAILTKTGITTIGVTSITGDIGTSPYAASTITGFGLIMDVSKCFSTTDPTSLVTGRVYAADYNTGACTTPADLNTAVLNMEAAYTAAAGAPAGVGSFLNVGTGTLTDLTLTPGVYTWGSAVTIPTDLTLSGSATDVWIFQISGTLDMATDKSVLLSGGALPQNIFWQVADAVTLQAGSHFEGIILAQTNIAMVTGASINGRLLAQTAVTLQSNTVTVPDAIPTPITHTQKNLDTWVPFGKNANVTVSTVDGKLFATGVPTGYTLVYYPNVGTYENYTGEVYPVVGTNMNLPIANDLNGGSGSTYCTIKNSNGDFANPGAIATGNCQGAKLWLVPTGNLTANPDGTYTINWSKASDILFEIGLMTYTIPLKPTAPAVTNDDTLNTVTGMATGMEYNLDGAGYVAYGDGVAFAALNFSGDHTLLVRVVAEGINPASNAVTLTFTTNSAPADTVAPTATVAYSTTTPTNTDVTATITPSETVTGDLTHVFTENGSFTFNFTDTAGNPGSVVATVANIDKTPPVIAVFGAGPAVNLGTAGNFAILSKAGITDVPSSTITGNIGTSPITGTAITGLGCGEMLTGKIYEVDAAYVRADMTCVIPGTTDGTPNANKTLVDNAVLDMGTAYTDAAGRAHGVGPNLNMGAGTLNGQNFVPGTYTWNTPGTVTKTGDITLTGSATDVWIFQITGTLNMAANKSIILAGGAQAKNIFWQVADVVTLLAGSHFEGNILAQTKIAMVTGATLNGRVLAQTEVTLIANTITAPASTPVDTVAPVIVVHADVSASGAVVTYTSPATSDAVDGAGVATCLPASGSTFPIGNTTVTCNATDVAGNQALATTFTVTVIGTPAPAPVVSVSSGGGSGGHRRPTPTPTSTPQVLGIATFNFTANLQLGTKGEAITELQKRLTAEGVYTGPITGYFGPLV